MKKTLILILVILIGMAFMVNQAVAKKPIIDQETLIYQISNAQVVTPGEVVDLPEGTWKRGITVEAKAKIKKGNMFPEGTFVLTYDAFSPTKDMGSQKAGMWYVVGSWTITKKDADPNQVKVKHNPDVANGDIMAELPFDPSTASQKWTAKAVMRMGLAAGRWSRGEGTLTLNEGMQGDLFLDLAR